MSRGVDEEKPSRLGAVLGFSSAICGMVAFSLLFALYVDVCF